MTKKNLSLWVGILLPILLIVLVALSVYLPGFLVQPQFDFLYVSGDVYSTKFAGGYLYQVVDGKLTESAVVPNWDSKGFERGNVPRLYVHDVSENKAREITFAEASKLNLDTYRVSPDGFEIVYGSDSRGFFPLFWGTSNNEARYLKGQNIGIKLNLEYDRASFFQDFRFLGWLK